MVQLPVCPRKGAGEVVYQTHMGGIALKPFASLAYVSIDTEFFPRAGGAEASLRGSGVFARFVGLGTAIELGHAEGRLSAWC